MQVQMRAGVAVSLTVAASLVACGQTLAPPAMLPATLLRAPAIARVNPPAESHRAAVWWGVSIAAVLTASAMDAATSVGKQESNPLLRGSQGAFGTRGVALKGALVALSLVPQFLLRKHHEYRRTFTVVNFAEAGILTGIAVHNSRVRAGP